MNKIKQWLWIKPNEYFDMEDTDNSTFIIYPIFPSLIADYLFKGSGVWVCMTSIVVYIIYRLVWRFANNSQNIETDEEVSDYDFDPIFSKSATREHLYSALESAKLSRQLAAAQEEEWEFQCWELVIQDIESMIDSYGE